MTTAYRYKAVDAQGRVARGVLDAANAADLELRLAHQGLDLIRFRTGAHDRLRARHPQLSRQELINFTFHLQQLISAGVPLVDALRDLGASVERARLRGVIAQLVSAIEGGKTFSQALESFPDLFGAVLVNVIRVGEQTGRLDTVLGELTDMQRWQGELAARARRVMIYPAVVGTVVLLAVLALMVLLVPQLVAFVAGTGNELPWYTAALVATSAFCVDWWFTLVALPVLAVSFSLLVRACPRCRFVRDRLTLRVWLVGPVIHKIKLARFANYFALMYASGISVLDAIVLSRGVVDNLALDQALGQVHARISGGAGISDSFARIGLFPALVVRMIRIGETGGAMDQALRNVSYFYDRQVTEAIDTLTPVLGPLLVGLIGIVLGWVMFSVLDPIYAAVLTMGGL